MILEEIELRRLAYVKSLGKRRKSTLPTQNPDSNECVALASLGYYVRYEESFAALYGARSKVYDPWLLIMPCQYGEIYPFGGSWLAINTKHKTRSLMKLPSARLYTDCGEGQTILVDVKYFPEIARIMRPKPLRKPRKPKTDDKG